MRPQQWGGVKLAVKAQEPPDHHGATGEGKLGRESESEAVFVRTEMWTRVMEAIDAAED